ncbi:MAG: TrkH family potassium uptake protein, partial [Clostridia bacterium]|nr:TrkH family potassium uptake protein [Clostridia bacterium]
MNYRIVFNNIGKLMIVEGAVMFVPLFTAILYREWIYAVSFLIAIAVSVAAGILMNLIKFGTRDIRIMDGFMIVALSWIFMSLTGAIPFFISGDIPNYGNAVFETISGLTTTGATIVPHIEAMGYSTLLWRSMTNWLGGMGMLVFMLAVIPLKKNENSLFIFKAESSGPDVTKIVPSMRESAKILYGIYIILTLLEVIFLAIGGMPIFDSICHALSTGGTGGFSIKDQSIGYYNSTYITVVIGIFMILFAINYAYYFLIFTGKVRDVLKSTELRIFVGLLVFSIVTITFVIRRFYPSLKDAALNAFFNTAAMITSTGF